MQGHAVSWTGSLLSLAVVAILVGVNAFFVAAEFAIVRVRRTRLQELAGQGIASARTTIVLVDRLSESMVTTQLGVTIASLGVG
jgi:CBS domain containing-hemolysin-like protein